MTGLRIEGVQHAYAGQPVLRGLDLAVPGGAIAALLGASGSGKTTLLRLVAGFERMGSGRIELGGRLLAGDGTHLPVERRRIGYVPQEGTLFPHLTVDGNVAFGLRRAERRAGRTAESLELTGLTGLERRFPHQLSGGQQQRTALARALAPRPGLMLLDEPFAALDLELRRSVCADVVALLRRTGTTSLLVTHDPVEAFASADLVAVMHGGVVAQCAGPEALYRCPVSREVARLTGPTLFLEARILDGRAETALGPVELHPGSPLAGEADLLLRPEQVTLAEPGRGTPATILSSAFRGDHTLVEARAGTAEITVRLQGLQTPGQTVGLAVIGRAMAYARPGSQPGSHGPPSRERASHDGVSLRGP